MSDVPPRINASDLKKNAGRVVRLAGEYRPEFNPRHRTLVEDANGNLTAAGCVVVLALEDGTFVDLFDRPEDEGRRLQGQAVEVTGTLCAPDTDTGDGSAAHASPLFHMIHISGIALTD